MKYLILLVCLCGSVYCVAQPPPFTTGNIVVYRAGDGSSALSSAAAPVYLDEYTADGSLVQSILLPTAASGSNNPLTAPGDNPFTGMLTLSADGKYLLVPGTNTLPGGSGSTASVLGVVDFNGKINTSTAVTDFTEGSNLPFSAKSDDGNRIWFGGTGAIRYTTSGSNTSVLLNNIVTYAVNIEAGQLYSASGSSGQKIFTVGSLLPTAAGQTLTAVPGLPTNIQVGSQFAFADLDPGIAGADVLYVSSPGAGNPSVNSGIRKFSLTATGWVSNGSVGAATTANAFYHGLTIKVSGTTVTIFATRRGNNANAIRGGELVKLIDNSGYNATLTGTPTVIASVSTTDAMAFRGVALVPQACKAVSGLRAYDVTALQATLSWNPVNGAGNYEYIVTTSPVPPSPSATGTIVSTTNPTITGLSNGIVYYVYVRTVCGVNSRSEWSVVQFETNCKSPLASLIDVTISGTGIATIKWNKVFGAMGYEYEVSGNALPPSTGIATSDTSVSVSLNAVSQYYIHVRTNCGSGAFSGWVTKPFSTNCLMPVLSVNVDHKNATIQWNRIQNVVRYEYALTYSQAHPLSGSYTTDTSYVINSLVNGSANYFHVRSICNNGAVSDWSTIDFYIQGLRVYPIPVRSILHINLQGISNGSPRINISDATGRIVRQIQFTGTATTVNVEGWAPGMYIVSFDDKQAKYRIKILKQ